MINDLKQNDLLYDYCRLNLSQQLERFLKNKIINITFKEGQLFQIAIAHGYAEILKILLNYYKQTQLQNDPETIEYKLAKYKLREIIEEAVDAYNVKDEIEELLKPYLSNYEEDENQNRDQELDELYAHVSSHSSSDSDGEMEYAKDNVNLIGEGQSNS